MSPTISDNIRAECARRNRNHTSVARGARISPATWSRRMAAPAEWRYSEIVAIARELDVDPVVLMPAQEGA